MKVAAFITLLLPTLLSAGMIEGSEVTRALVSSALVNKVPLRLITAICDVESNLNPRAVNHYDGGTPSYGLCQIKLATARGLGFRGSVNKLYNSYINANYAGKYIRYQLDRYGQDWVRAISAYNKGSTGVRVTNRKYVNKVLRRAMGY